MTTHAIDIFYEMCDACRRGQCMHPRSANDKEYFAQDWFIERLEALGLAYVQQGRNSYPEILSEAVDDGRKNAAYPWC